METIKITDSRSEMAEIGKEIFAEKSKIYDERMMKIIWEKINRVHPNASDSEKWNLFYCAVYDYWVYGNNIGEEFFYDFVHKTHEEKNEYITFRNRYAYMNFLNDKDDSEICRSKWLSYKKFNKHYHREAILLHDDEDFDKFAEFAAKHNEFVVKPVTLGLAIGVRKIVVSDYPNVRAIFDEILATGKELVKNHPWAGGDSDMQCEEVIKQSEHMAALHPWSVNAVRITTVRMIWGGGVKSFYPFVKVGNGKEFVTSGFYGSFLAGVDSDTGVIKTDGFTENCEIFMSHPITGIKLKGFQIPDWDGLMKVCEDASNMLPSVRYIGWDMVHTDEYGWVIMEANHLGEFIGQQMSKGAGLKKEFEELIGWKPKSEFWWKC